MKRKNNGLRRLLALVAILSFIWGMQTIWTGKHIKELGQEKPVAKTSPSVKKEATKAKSSLPEVSPDDWELILVNREHPTEELSPELAVVGNVYVDARIAEATEQFLAAAQEIDPAEHLISGYRSIDYQDGIYNYYVEQEMLADPSLTQEVAEEKVQTYSQPPSFSEHHTGLAIDMSTVDSLNQSSPAVVSKIAALAPRYGFVLRYPKGQEAVTGIAYEDWHFRYVGVESAKYMKKHKLTLEAYLEKLRGQKAE